MKIPKVFISYSHDSKEHKQWVLDLATRLRNSGVDATLDQWELKPGDDLPHFMEQHLSISDFVLMICTDRYVVKANSGEGGVGYEKMIITSELLSKIDSNKVIPIIRQDGSYNVPTFLKSKLFIDFSADDDFEFSFDELIRTIHNAPVFEKPELGNNPFKSTEQARPDKTGDAIKKLMRYVVGSFESGEDYARYVWINDQMDTSRIMLDKIIEDAVNKGLVILDKDGDLVLTEQGKKYAIDHKLVK